MKIILIAFFILFCFSGCNKEEKELKKLQIENEKLKSEILKKQVETISATEAAEQEKKLFQWGQLKNAYQRQYAIVGKLVEFLDSHKESFAVMGKQSLTGVTEALLKVNNLIERINKTTDGETFHVFQIEQDGLSKNLTNLIAVIEDNPKLKAIQDFINLRIQLEAAKNRIAVERLRLKDLK